MKILPKPKSLGQAKPRQQVGVIVSNSLPEEKQPSAGKELVRKIIPKPSPALKAGAPRVLTVRPPQKKAPPQTFASRPDSDYIIRYIDRSEILIKACLDGGDKEGARIIFTQTVNDSYKYLIKHLLMVTKALETGKVKLADRGSRVLLDCYCVSAELYYVHDQPFISDGLFDAIGQELNKRHDRFIHEWGEPDILRYPKGCFEPAQAHAIYRDDSHKRMAREIANVLRTANHVPPPKPRPTLRPGIKSRWS